MRAYLATKPAVPDTAEEERLLDLLERYEAARAARGAAAAIAEVLAAVRAATAERVPAVAAELALAELSHTTPGQARLALPLPRAAFLDLFVVGAPAADAEAIAAAVGAAWPAVVDGWTLEALVGRGAYGCVFRAVRAAPDTTEGPEIVALKLLHQPEPSPPVRIAHSRVLVPERWVALPDGRAYGTMPFVDGETLEAYLARHRTADTLPPLERVLAIMRQLAELLVPVHQRTLHRDLKPANVLLDREGNVYLTDFGLALTREHRHAEWARQQRAGTPLYMAPEAFLDVFPADQIPERSPSPLATADVWSVGVMLYELLTLEHPFGTDTEALLANLPGAACDDPRVRRPRLPESVAALCLRCLQRDPVNRPRSAAELLRELRQAERDGKLPRPPRTFAARVAGRQVGAPAIVMLTAAVVAGAAYRRSQQPLPNNGVASGRSSESPVVTPVVLPPDSSPPNAEPAPGRPQPDPSVAGPGRPADTAAVRPPPPPPPHDSATTQPVGPWAALQVELDDGELVLRSQAGALSVNECMRAAPRASISAGGTTLTDLPMCFPANGSDRDARITLATSAMLARLASSTPACIGLVVRQVGSGEKDAILRSETVEPTWSAAKRLERIRSSVCTPLSPR